MAHLGRCPISIHALLAESDPLWAQYRRIIKNFYPRSPCGERPGRKTPPLHGQNFYPRSPCGERPTAPYKRASGSGISIHALLAESDYADCAKAKDIVLFLSTLSLRRATHTSHTRHQLADISIHALLAESDLFRQMAAESAGISIHALLAESDKELQTLIDAVPDISIHALLAESD